MEISRQLFDENCHDFLLKIQSLGFEWTNIKKDGKLFLRHRIIESIDSTVLTKEYHVCYNESYQVPVLFFNFWLPDGKLLPLEKVWQHVSPVHKEELNSDPWTAITQSEHPHLHTPFYHIHPCHTGKVMQKLGEHLKNRLALNLSPSNHYLLSLLQHFMSNPGGLDSVAAAEAAVRFPLPARNRHFEGFDHANEGKWTAPFCFIQAADSQFGMMANYSPDMPETRQKLVKWDQEVTLLQRCVAAANRLEPKPRFFVVCGDLVDAMPPVSYRWEQVRDYKAVLSKLDAAIRPVCVCGNHDVGDAPTPQTIGQYVTDFGDDYFSFWVGGVKFLVLNSQFYEDSTHVIQMQRQHDLWLDEQLAHDHKAKWKHLVGFQHIPPFLHDKNEDAVNVFGNPKLHFNFADKDARFTFLNKLKKAGMGKLFCGHYHRNAGGWDDDLEVVVTSAVGCQLGDDTHGLRIVSVFEDRIEHKYYPVEDIPVTVDLH